MGKVLRRWMSGVGGEAVIIGSDRGNSTGTNCRVGAMPLAHAPGEPLAYDVGVQAVHDGHGRD